MSAIKIALQHSRKSGRKKTPETTSSEASPDSKCPICLDIFNNVSYLDICLHKFCFRCIHEWSKNKAECPLCKQPFNSIYHTIKSEQDFQKYDLQPVNNGSFGSFGGVRFRYRTTLTGVNQQAHRRTSLPPDNGVMFEASSRPQPNQDRYVRRMLMRLAAKRKAAREGRAVNNVKEQEMVNFRRELYRQGVRVRDVRDGGRSRDTSAEFYRRNPACLHRLIPWLKRELTVLYGAHGSLVNIVQHIIMSRITQYDMEEGAILDELRPFIQVRTEHFLHEFISFAKSPFHMEAYDQHAVYDCPGQSSNEDSSSNSSVIAISEDEEDTLDLDPQGESTSTQEQSLWDDETPGPSYTSISEQSQAYRLHIPDTDSDSSLEEEMQELDASPQMYPTDQRHLTQGEDNNRDVTSSDNDDCVIVGFVKPTTDRTPELVQLSSDSEEEEAKEAPLCLPQHIRFSSLSPPASEICDASATRQSENTRKDHRHRSDSKDRSRSPKSSRHKTSGKTDRKERGKEKPKERHWSKEKHERRRRRSSSREYRHSSRSPGSISTSCKGRGYSYYSGRDSKHDSNFKKDTHHSYQSYRRYSQERNNSRLHYTEKRSYYCSRNYSYRRSYSRSRSCSSDSLRRDRRRSRSASSSRSPVARSKSSHNKPGGKRKYKTRHLEQPADENNAPTLCHKEADSAPLTKHKKKSKEKHRKKSKEKLRKTSRSKSVELVNEENAQERSRRHHKKKKKHRKKNKKHRNDGHVEKRSPTVITINSDSDSVANDNVTHAISTIKDCVIDSATNE